MEKRTLWDKLRTVYRHYDRLMERQGFYVVLAVCVAVILVSAVLTFRQRRQAELPLVVEQVKTAGGTQQAQTLEEALAQTTATGTPLAVPTEMPLAYGQPVSGVTIRLFSLEEPQYFEAANTWQLHSGIDLQTDYGTPVVASAPGKVIFAGQSGTMGLCVELAHSDGLTTFYAGLAEAGFIREGDPVQRGQMIGLAGNGVVAESSDGPHLHFEVRRNGQPIDPLLLFLGIDNNDTL